MAGDAFTGTVLLAQGPVLVEFWADWCRHCGQMAPIVAELAREFAGRVVVATVDVVASPGDARQAGVRMIPTFVMYEGGAEKSRVVGAQPKARIRELIEEALAKGR